VQSAEVGQRGGQRGDRQVLQQAYRAAPGMGIGAAADGLAGLLVQQEHPLGVGEQRLAGRRQPGPCIL